MTDLDDLRLEDFLGHILEATDRCLSYVAGMDEAEFLSDQKTQDAVIRTIEIVGEASNNIRKRYPEMPARFPEVPFALAYEMRNVVAHGYFKVDLFVVWRTVENDLPRLKETVRNVLASLTRQDRSGQDGTGPAG
jgi:uncharacterized protein with HEPN domain